MSGKRRSAAAVYDKYFMAQATPDKSEFGTQVREQARQGLNDILNGRTVLRGVHMLANRFVNSTIKSRYALPKVDLDGNTSIEKI